MRAPDPPEAPPWRVSAAEPWGVPGPGAPLPHELPSPETALREAIRAAGLELGFVRVGFAAAEPDFDAARALDAWREAGHAGELSYLSAPPERHDPRALLPEARTVIVAALPHPAAPPAGGARPALIARFSRGDDYHDQVRSRLLALAGRAAALADRAVRSRACVDSAPLLEHAFAARAGVGFTGRHTLTIVPGAGSHVALGELLVDLALPPDPPLEPRCGRCTRCLDACPTGALLGPFTLDARRCIAYLTIELKGAIPRDLRPSIGGWVFGCDRCQEICPYVAARRRSGAPSPPAARSPLQGLDLVDLLRLGSAAHRRLSRGTALQRVSRPRLARNAAVALGNLGDLGVVPDLCRALQEDSSALVREHAAWALGRLAAREGRPGAVPPDPSGGAALVRQASEALARARDLDPAVEVREEADLAHRAATAVAR